MRKTLFGLLVGAAIVVGATAILSSTPTMAAGCKRGSHLVVCPTYSFCCPDNAFCVCF